MESAAEVANLGTAKRKRLVKKTEKSTEGNTLKKVKQVVKKSNLLKIYQETSISVDQIKDLGAISHLPLTGGEKQRMTLNFKNKKHEPVVINVDQKDLKNVAKRVRDFHRKYAEDDDDEQIEQKEHKDPQEEEESKLEKDSDSDNGFDSD